MKKLVLLLITLASTAAFAQQAANNNAASATQPPATKAHILSNEEIDNWLAKPDKVLLIDLRRPDEVSSIGGFPVYLSIQFKDLESSLKWIPKNRTIITVSNHTSRSGRAADLLASKGFKVAGVAGADTYTKTGGKWVTKIAIPPPRTPTAASEAK